MVERRIAVGRRVVRRMAASFSISPLIFKTVLRNGNGSSMTL